MKKCNRCRHEGKSDYCGCAPIGDGFIPAFSVRYRGGDVVLIGRKNALSYAKFLSKTFNRWVYMEFCGVAKA